MLRLSLDYQKSRSSAAIIGAALLLAGIATATFMTLQFRSVELALATAEENTGRLEQQVKRGKNISQPTKSTPELQQKALLANTILMQLAFPWGELFKTLESSNTDKIALLAIQPDMGKHSVKINGEAKDFTALLDYIQQLEQDKLMTNIVLLNHEINQQTPEKPVRFALTANWGAQP